MLKAKFLLPFGSNPVRVAAFCFKNLRKIQFGKLVGEGEVLAGFSCKIVDVALLVSEYKILQDELDVVSYRVLGYLLLGIVRIYSKKVEYALDDCNEILIKINKFVGNREDFSHVETLRMSVSIPSKLQLDAFELDLLEDTGRDHTAPSEEITISDKEVVCKTGGFGLFSQEKGFSVPLLENLFNNSILKTSNVDRAKEQVGVMALLAILFEEFDINENTCSFDRDKVGNAHLSQLLSMMGIKVDPVSSPESRDTLENSMFSLMEPMNLDNVLIVEGLEKESVNLSGQDQQIIEEQIIEDIVPTDDEINEESSRISQVDINMFCGREEEHVLSVEEFTKYRQVDTAQSSAKETFSSLCNMNEEVIEVHVARSLEESIENPQDKKSHENECVYHVNSSVANDIHEEHIEGAVEKRYSNRKLGVREKVSLEDENLSFTPSKSKNLEVTPQSKFRDDSVGMPKHGATTPESMFISTPAARDHSQFSRKRRAVLDQKKIVLPNNSYLDVDILALSSIECYILNHFRVIMKRLRSTEDIVRKRRKYHCTSLAWNRESPISCHPDIFYEPLLPCCSSELQLLFSKEKIKLPDSLKIMETSGNLAVLGSPTIATPRSPPQLSDSVEIEKTPRMLDVFESLLSDIPKHVPTAPQTYPSSTLENEFPSLMDEEINSFEADNAKLAGWSDRTRVVANYLKKSFLPARNQKEKSVLNFSKVFGGRARKEGARLFYEVLVLKTTGYVDVEQNEAYGDIAISKLPKLDQTF
ncbi:unnamed protein product [Sphenostylis stenocarpa]|uniref:Sister chromatid cohesion 1 protein 2 n=1 Tax=Sphenostylis stenocarpa TaxID=92480 RepID=A0AA86V4Y6_9FABA|nr:unnamed protein product [Sphenostylis stenocarpa]